MGYRSMRMRFLDLETEEIFAQADDGDELRGHWLRASLAIEVFWRSDGLSLLEMRPPPVKPDVSSPA